MLYNFNGKSITISDIEIKNLMASLELSKEDAIDLWLSDNGYEDNEEQEELDKKASKVKIGRDIAQTKDKKPRKKPEIKVSDQKKALFDAILTNLQLIYGENVSIMTENKLISVKVDDLSFKIDIIQQRKAKN